tara:strand:- start:732 stop:1160 length:429 start_codon:yes stop_codon:yes gene_type:complete
MIVWVVLLLVNILVFFNTKEDERLKEVKVRYKKLREHLKSTNAEEFRMLHEEIPITAHYGMSHAIGYNANKGAEIGLCIDGTVNDIFHVFLHELAHCTVDEYSHSKHFWNMFDKLKGEAIAIGIYENISTRTPFCGKHIMDK